MDQHDPLNEALLQWISSFSPSSLPQTLADLSTGVVLWQILLAIDPDYFKGSIPEPHLNTSDDWIGKWQNLRHIEKQLSLYYRDVCNGDEVSGANSPDLKAIAAKANASEIGKLVMLVIRAGMESPAANQAMGRRLMGLGRERAMIIAGELRAMQEAQEEEQPDESEPVSRDESAYASEAESAHEKQNGFKSSTGSGAFSDPLLEKEEELLKAQAMIDRLEGSYAAAQRQVLELRAEQGKLQEAFDTYRNEIDAKGRKGGSEEAVKKLQRQTESDKSYIGDLETRLQTSQGTVERLERQTQKHKDDSEANQTLRDELQLLRSENEDLMQKIKANENLKKKIQALQEQERASVTLREELKLKDDKLEELDRLKSIQVNLEKEIIEKRGLIRNQEYQITELTTTRKHAEYDSRVLAQKLEAARERHGQDHEALEGLRQKLQDLETGETGAGARKDVENEIASSDAASKARPPPDTYEESRHLTEKLAMLETQLEAADARLKQAAERGEAHDTVKGSYEASKAECERLRTFTQEQEIKVTELRKQLDVAAKAPSPAVAPELASLQRENRLMTSAWHDLSSRLQSNGVSLARRRQEPRSWIGKQRALVGPGVGAV
ncbi:hypothetical protein B0A48_15356 [Cryoendolithus antarcticus]|uniref:HOOK N-terminal domain-containing protein n=1 Tax=Cryoendolithus antarcticus TaxID=1507870 RepID=A0A1V8SI97_9PEZI|nr:hypothetical protein B0A48_15356 [Cryoendolithus antarcticus]